MESESHKEKQPHIVRHGTFRKMEDSDGFWEGGGDMNKRDVIAAIGIILFILGACGCDGQPVVCGIVSLIGLMIVYACQKREEYEKKKRDFETKK